MKKQYHFSFVFSCIRLLRETHEALDFPTHFKIYLLESCSLEEESKLLGQTGLVEALLNDEGAIEIREEIRCVLGEESMRFPAVLALQLTELQENEEQLVGTYQFAAGNYAHISDRLNRHCLQLTVQIGGNYSLQYQVFVDSSRQGVQQMRREHLHAKVRKCSIDQDFSDETTFTRQRTRQIRLNNDDPAIASQRYWSPSRAETHPSPQRRRRALLKKGSYNEVSFTRCENDASLSFIESKKEDLTIDDGEEERALSEDNKGQSMILQPEVESNSADEDQQKTMKEVYQVISCNSRVTLPEGEDPHTKASSAEKMQSSARQYSHSTIAAYTRQASLFLLLVFALAMLISWMSVRSGRHPRQYTLFV